MIAKRGCYETTKLGKYWRNQSSLIQTLNYNIIMLVILQTLTLVNIAVRNDFQALTSM